MTPSYAICHVHGCCIGQARVDVDPDLLDAARRRLGVDDQAAVIDAALRLLAGGTAPADSEGRDR